MAAKRSATWLLASALALTAGACHDEPTVTVPGAVERTLSAGTFRYVLDTDGTRTAGRFETPDRGEVSVEGGKSQFTIGNTWYVADSLRGGYTCHVADQPFLPAVAVQVLRDAVSAGRGHGSAQEKFSFRNGKLRATLSIAGGVVRRATFSARGKSGTITYSDIGSAGHIIPPPCN